MPVTAGQPPTGTDIVAFTLAVIALMQLLIWRREREPGTRWLAGAFALNVVLAALHDTLLPVGGEPPLRGLAIGLAVHGCYAIGLSHDVRIEAAWRGRVVALLVAPLAAELLLAAFGVSLGLLAWVPALYAPLGLAVLCVHAARREPGAGHALLAGAALFGALYLLVAASRGMDPVIVRLEAWPPAIAFGIALIVSSLMRRRHAMELTQARALRMSSFYAALSQTNHAIVRIADPQALYQEICRISVETGHAVLAYVGVPQDGRLRPVASAGPVDDLLAGLRIDLDPSSPYAQGPASTSVRTGVPQVRNDMLADARIAPWHERARRVGVRAQASFPLRRGGEVVAAFTLYMGQPGAFDDAVVKLLEEMSHDVSFALDNMARETARVQALELAEAGLQRFARLFHSAPVSAVLLAMPGLEIIDANQSFCERYGVAREEAIGRSPAALGIGPFDETGEVFHDHVIIDHHVRNMVARVRVRSGDVREVLLNGELIEYQDQHCILSMSLDITELRQAEKAREAQVVAESANRAKTEFLSRMSHELRTPLNAVLGFSQLLQSEAHARLLPRELAQLEHIEQAGWHLLTLINDVLDVSRIEAGHYQINAHGLALTPLLDEALQMSEVLAEKYGVVVEAPYRKGAVVGVHADPLRLRQIMLNLLSNAIKYNRPGGFVRVEVRREGETAILDVADTGLGMTREQLEHLYEPFNRLGRERGGIEGTGIGLALTRQLLRLMGGEMEVHSEIGKGTSVRVSLPYAQPPAPPMPAPGAAPASAASAGPQGVVLYIEDNQVNVLLVEKMLARWSEVRFVHAEDGASGIELARTLLPDLVLLDMQLPDMDGNAVLTALRGEQATRSLNIVVLSADAMPDEIERARRHGANDYWTKPLVFDRFLSDVARLLRQEALAGHAGAAK